MSMPPPATLRSAALGLVPLTGVPAVAGPLAVAVSGGADSVYLLCALWADTALRPRLHVLHFDHRVRGEDAALDARFVQELCAALSVPCSVGVRAEQGPASEADLRTARNGFFAEQNHIHGTRVLCTAHHLDDVVENSLLRLARGAGLAGLAAPRVLQEFKDGTYRWRPLIAAGLTKDALLSALQAQGIPWREDATNAQPVAKRNRIRAWLAAGGEAALGVGYAQGFARSARILDDAQLALAVWARELGCVVAADGSMPVHALQGRPPALIQEALRTFLYFHAVSEPGVRSLEPLAAALTSGGEARSMVRGRLLAVHAGVLQLASAQVIAHGEHPRRLLLGQVDDEAGLLAESVDVDAAQWASLSQGDISPAREVYLLAPDHPLTWRGRVDGDRYHPLGAPGSAKLSDLLINRKIPASRRDALPVVLAGDAILWVPGLPPAEQLRLTGPTKGALRLTWLGPCLT